MRGQEANVISDYILKVFDLQVWRVSDLITEVLLPLFNINKSVIADIRIRSMRRHDGGG